MRIINLKIQGFRSFQNELINFEPNLTTFAGENNTGKSTIGLIITKLFMWMATGQNQIIKEDYPHNQTSKILLRAQIELNRDEFYEIFVPQIFPNDLANMPRFQIWVLEQGLKFDVTFTEPYVNNDPIILWGGFKIYGSIFSKNDIKQEISNQDLIECFKKAAKECNSNEEINNALSGQYACSGAFQTLLGNFLLIHYKIIDEFRFRSQISPRQSAFTESMNGLEIANVLFTLKMHSIRAEKARYTEIQNAFHTLFPHYRMDVVESAPGSNTPAIQFYEEDQPEPLALSQVSAGVCETLTLLTNLIGRIGLIVFLEHPELHLHPHALRWLKSLLYKSSEQNQIIIITHDPFLIDVKTVLGLRRFWWLPEQGTKICSPNGTMSQIELAQMGTALRNLGDREVVFARSVLLVEDESLKEFIIEIAPTLGYDIDAHSVSIIFTGGHGGHRPFQTLLKCLGIPHICLRDLTWGNNKEYPSEQFYSLGAEFEKYMDSQGLDEIRNEIILEAGNSHRRQAVLLGQKLKKQQIPSIFDDILKSVVKLAINKTITD